MADDKSPNLHYIILKYSLDLDKFYANINSLKEVQFHTVIQ